jgi:hypothetical protein
MADMNNAGRPVPIMADRSDAEIARLTAQVQRDRQRLAATTAELAAKADVKSRAKHKVSDIKSRASDRRAMMSDRAQNTMSGMKSKMSDRRADMMSRMSDRRAMMSEKTHDHAGDMKMKMSDRAGMMRDRTPAWAPVAAVAAGLGIAGFAIWRKRRSGTVVVSLRPGSRSFWPSNTSRWPANRSGSEKRWMWHRD